MPVCVPLACPAPAFDALPFAAPVVGFVELDAAGLEVGAGGGVFVLLFDCPASAIPGAITNTANAVHIHVLNFPISILLGFIAPSSSSNFSFCFIHKNVTKFVIP